MMIAGQSSLNVLRSLTLKLRTMYSVQQCKENVSYTQHVEEVYSLAQIGSKVDYLL